MSFNTALDAGQLQSLRGTDSSAPSFRARFFLSLCPNDNVYTARVFQSSFATSFAQVSYNTGSGTLADVRAGQTVLISHTSDRAKAFFVGRVRKTPTSTVLYINETSSPVENGDYIFVLDDYRIWDKLARTDGNTLKVDYETTFRQLLPLISNLKSSYAVWDASGTHEFDYAPDVDPATSGATISSYLWEVADGTITVGVDTDKDITVEFPAGFRYIHFTATDSGGRSLTRHIPVWVHDSTFPPTLLTHGDLSVEASIDEGFTGSVTAFDGVDAILDNTLLVAWSDGDTYNGSAEIIDANNILIGRIRTEANQTSYDEETGQIDAQTRFEIESPLQQLGRLEMKNIQMDVSGSPTKFGQIKVLTLWREIAYVLSEFSTFSELHSLTFSDMTDDFREKGVVTQANNLLAVIDALANGINAKLQMNAGGEAEIARDAVLLPTADRDALVTVADWTTSDIFGLSLSHDHVKPIGWLESSGGSYNPTSGKVTVAQAVAPGRAQGPGSESSTLHNQILTYNQTLVQSEAELCDRAGHKIEAAQGADELTIEHPDGYWFLTPSVDQWYTLTLSGDETAKEIVLDDTTRWQLVSLSLTFELETGRRTIGAVYRKETIGAPAQAIRYPASTNKPFALPKFPALPTFPALDILPSFFLPDELTSDIAPPLLSGTPVSGILARDGNTQVVWTTSQVFVTQDALTSFAPTWIEVTPPIAEGATIVQCRFTSSNPPGLLVAVEGGAAVTFDLTDFPMDGPAWSNYENSGTVDGAVTDRDVDGFEVTSTAAINNAGVLRLQIPDVPFFHITRLEYDLDSTSATVLSASQMADDPDVTTVTNIESSTDVVPRSYASGVIDADGFSLLMGFSPAGFPHVTTVSNVILEGYYTNSRVFYAPNAFDVAVDWSEGASISTDNVAAMRIGATFNKVFIWDAVEGQTFYSADYGDTFDDPDADGGSVPATPAGFDAQKLGNVTLLGVDGQVQRAITAGGSYSGYGDPLPASAVATAIFIPRYKFAGTSNGPGVSAPDYLLASDTQSGGESVWKVTASGVTFTAITPNDGSADGVAVGPNCLHIPWYSNAYQDIFALLNFGGTRKLARSINGGSAWIFSGALSASAAYVTTRRGDTRRSQVFVANGPNVAYCSNYRASPLVLVDLLGPTADDLLGIDVLW